MTNEYQGRFSDGTNGVTSLVKTGAGAQILRNLSGIPSSHSGTTSVNEGRLVAASGTGLSSKSPHVIAEGAVLELAGVSATIGSLAGPGSVEGRPAADAQFSDDFSSGEISRGGGRFRESSIDLGWYTDNLSAWVITNGVMQNAATNSGGYPVAKPAEASLAQMFTNPFTGTDLTLSFDYNVGTNDQLFVHFWAAINTNDFVNNGNIIANIEACNGTHINDERSKHLNADNPLIFSELDVINLKNGATSFGGGSGDAVVALVGGGTSVTTVALADLGIPGVESMADLDFISVAFAKEEDGTPGITWVDNVSVSDGSLTLNLGGDDTDATFAGSIDEMPGAGPISILKVGAGMQTLSGTNATAYTGGTMVNGGTLRLENAGIRYLDGGAQDPVIGDGGILEIGDGTSLRLLPNAGTVDVRAGGRLNVNGGTVEQDLTQTNAVVVSVVRNDGGTVAVESGALLITNGVPQTVLIVKNNLEVSGGEMVLQAQTRLQGELRVIGSDGSVNLGWLGSHGGVSGSLVWELDSAGVSPVICSGWASLGPHSITVDGTGYGGGSTNLLLLQCAAIVNTSSVVNVTGFNQSVYRATVTQDEAQDWVRLNIDYSPGSSLILY